MHLHEGVQCDWSKFLVPLIRAGRECNDPEQTAHAQEWEGPDKDKEHRVHHHHL